MGHPQSGESVFITPRGCRGGREYTHRVRLKEGTLLKTFSPSSSKNSFHKYIIPMIVNMIPSQTYTGVYKHKDICRNERLWGYF